MIVSTVYKRSLLAYILCKKNTMLSECNFLTEFLYKCKPKGKLDSKLKVEWTKIA